MQLQLPHSYANNYASDFRSRYLMAQWSPRITNMRNQRFPRSRYTARVGWLSRNSATSEQKPGARQARGKCGLLVMRTQC
jgi:hypothetical protein